MTLADGDKVLALRQQVDDVRSTMLSNVERMMGRAESLRELSEKTRLLEQDAGRFQRTARTTQRAFRVRWFVLLSAVGVFLVLIVLLVLWFRNV